MFIIPLLIIVVILVVFVDRREKSRQKHRSGQTDEDEENYDDEAKRINHEIMAELDKPEPDMEKIKNLRSKMQRLENENHTSSNTTPANENNSGITAALYAGSLLVLAGVGGLVASGFNAAGLLLLILAAAAFYTGGILMRNSEKFKQVSQVFVGTGMLMLPFIGILLQNITQIDPRIIWLIMSLIGIPIFIYATFIMNNKVFSFFAIAGFVSLSCSLSATMSLGVMWYFALVMGLGIIFDLIKIFAPPKKLKIMENAIQMSGEWLPLATFIASLLAVYAISEIEYLILLTIIILQFILNFWHNSNTIWESCLRLAIPAWVILLIHIIVPTNFATGIALALVATGELICSFLIIKRPGTTKTPRNIIELFWSGASMISYVVASLLISNFDISEAWLYILIAMLINAILIVAARFHFNMYEWYFGLLPIGIVMPIALVNIMNLTGDSAVAFYIATYALGIFGLEALGWVGNNTAEISQKTPNKKSSNTSLRDFKVFYLSNGDILAISGMIIFGLAMFIAKPTALIAAIIFMLVTLGLGARSLAIKNRYLAESAVYTTAATLIALVLEFVPASSGQLIGVLIAHTVFLGFLVSSLLWETKTRTRLAIGVIELLVTMGILAFTNTTWIMMLFMLEAAAALVSGLTLKLKPLWIAGTVALFLAVLWFTRELSFVWPVILGLGIIAAVIIVIWQNDKKNKYKKFKP